MTYELVETTRKNICQCLKCGEVFEFDGEMKCPHCKKRYVTFIQMKNPNDEEYLIKLSEQYSK